MKKLLPLLLTLLAADICAAEKPLIRIHPDQTDLLYRIDDQGRLCQSYLGPAFRNPEDLRLLPAGDEAFTTYGSKNYFTPALRLTHNDGNGSLQLAYVSHETRSAADGVTETSILLRDEAYPVEVKLILTAFERENVIKSRTEIVHYERKPVTLYEYASSMLRLGAGSYYLTEFTGDWAHEVNKSERRLDFGKKVLDSSLGGQHVLPSAVRRNPRRPDVRNRRGGASGHAGMDGQFPVHLRSGPEQRPAHPLRHQPLRVGILPASP